MRDETRNNKYRYIEDLYANEDVVLKRARERANILGNEYMCVVPLEGRILQFLVELSQAEKVVEIGTLVGCSAIWMARALPSNGRLFTIEKDMRHVVKARETFVDFESSDKITFLEGAAEDWLPKISCEGPFDLIFVDGQKTSYGFYLDWCEANLRQGGILVADNTLLFGSVYGDSSSESATIERQRVMQEFNDHLADRKRWSTIILPTSEGLTIARKIS